MTFKVMDQKDMDRLVSICGAERVFWKDAINEDFSHDELAGIRKYPEVLVEPLTTEEVADIMRYAFEQNIPVTPRGAGTGLVGGAVALSGGIMLNMSKMNKILELDEDNLTITVEPGVMLMEVAQYVETHDLFYPPDPGEKTATIGGNISTNAGGMRAVKYGVTRDYVMGLEVVLADGEIIDVGGKIAKNSSGYSLMNMFVGAEGTLGIVTKAILKLLPLPKRRISLLVPFPKLSMAVETVPKIIKSRTIPTAIEFMEREVIKAAEEYLGKKFPDSSADAYLLLQFDGNSKKEIEEIYEYVAYICLDAGATDVLIANTQERHDAIWTARGAFLEAIHASTTEMDECDVVVPRSRIADFIKYTETLDDKIKIRIRSFGHAGDGNMHLYVLRDDLPEDVWHCKLDEAFGCMYDKANELCGQVSGEHGIGFAKKEFLHQAIGPAATRLLANIKQAFDPKGILNPGKIC